MAWGRITFAPWTPAVSCHKTYFDLASLTKPIATSCSIITLVEQGKIDISDSIAEIVPNVPSEKSAITIRQLLTHSSGLPAHVPFYTKWMRDTKKGHVVASHEIINSVLDTPLQYSPGTKAVYSDLGFMLLGCIVEIISGMKFQDYVAESVLAPLSARNIRPDSDLLHTVAHTEIAPTGMCPLEHRIIHGRTNDLNARTIGGLCGHAGLFGTAKGVHDLLARLMDVYRSKLEIQNFSRPTIEQFWSRDNNVADSTWALGFDTPSPEGSSAGRLFSQKSVGHLGFTGTSFWIDTEKDIIVVFLSNRTFPKATEESQEAMKRFRPRLHDAVMKILHAQ